MRKKNEKGWIVPVILITVFCVILVALFSFSYDKKPVGLRSGNVAVIRINGDIGVSSILGNGVDSDEVVGLIEKAGKNRDVDAILIKINSGGGSPVASEEIVNAIKDSGKFTVAVIEDVGASGAYWVASAADVIIASPASITGSIGVTASYLEFSGLMEKYGVGYEELKAGEYKEMGSPFRNLTLEEKVLFQKTLDQLHEYFIASIKENRDLNDDQVKKVSTAMFFMGKEAKELGLVDVLGGMREAKDVIREELGVKDVNLIEYSRPKGLLESIFSEFFAARTPGLISKQPMVKAGGFYSVPVLS